MLLSLEWLFTSVWGRRILAGAGLLVLALGIRAYFIHEGKLKELTAAQQATLKDTTAKLSQERNDLAKQIQDSRAALAGAAAEIQKAQAQQRAILAQIAGVAAQKKTSETAVAKLPDSSLHGFITDKLAVRSKEDQTPGYLPTEERALASCLTDEPLCEQSNVLLQKQSAEQDSEIKARESQVQTLQGNYELLRTYTEGLQADYATIFKLFAAKKRGPRCLWLWHCQAQKPPVPDPHDLKLPAISN